jgi:hypothetical protein
MSSLPLSRDAFAATPQLQADTQAEQSLLIIRHHHIRSMAQSSPAASFRAACCTQQALRALLLCGLMVVAACQEAGVLHSERMRKLQAVSKPIKWAPKTSAVGYSGKALLEKPW